MRKIRPYILGIHGLELTDDERSLFQENPPFGIILFLRNVDSPDQLRKLIDDIKTTTNGLSLIFVDQEGGRVQRLAPPYWPKYPIAGDFDDLHGDYFDEAVYALYRLICDDLAIADIDANCAPCLDLRNPHTATFLQDRTFGSDKGRVIRAGHACVRAIKDAGLSPVIKHLPGHGRAKVDSHQELPHVFFDDDPYDQASDDMIIFEEQYGVDMAMNAHILYPQIDPDYPLTLSRKGIEFIRNNIGFSGLIMSDDLAMKALKGSQGELSKRAFEAGLDVALSCSGKFEEISEIYELDIAPNSLTQDTHIKLVEISKTKPQPLSLEEREYYFSKIVVS